MREIAGILNQIPKRAILLVSLLALFACGEKEKEPLQSVNLAGREITPETDSLIDVQIALADHYAGQQKLEEAQGSLQLALELSIGEVGYFHPKTAQVHHQTGNLFNNYLQDRPRAASHFAEAICIRKALLTTADGIGVELGKSYFALARVQRLQGKYQPALENIHLCLSIRESSQPVDSMRLGRTYFEAGVIYQQSGDLRNALRYLQQAASYATGLSDEASAWNEMAATYDLLSQPGQAVHFFHKALDRYRTLEDWWSIGSCLVNLGGAYLRNAENEEALATLTEALELNQLLIGADPDDADVRLARGAILSNLGILYKRQGKLDKALEAAKESLRISINNCGTAYHPDVASSFDNLGNVYAEMKDAEAALMAYKNGIHSIMPNFDPLNLLENPTLATHPVSEKPLLLTLLADKAKALVTFAPEQDDPLAWQIAAFSTCQTLDTLLMQTRQSCREDGSKYFLAEEAAALYEQAIGQAFYLWESTGNPVFRDAILTFCERNKAGVLIESLNEVQAKKQLNVDDHLLEQELAVQQAIAQCEVDIYHARQHGAPAALLSDSLFFLKRKMERISRKIEREAPGYFTRKFTLSQPPAPAEIQANLLSGQMMIAYFLGQKDVYTIALTHASFQLYRRPVSPLFLGEVEKFRRAVSDLDFVKNRPQEAEAAYLSSAHFLFDYLLEQPLSGTAEKITSLVLVTDGVLGYLPFEALLAQPADHWKSPHLPYVLHNYAVSYAYAAHFLVKPQTVASASNRYEFAGFGLEYDTHTLNAAFTDQRSPGDGQAANNGRPLLGKLPFSAQEVADITEMMGGKCWLDDAATKENFLEYASQARIIHFAGHGFTDARQPLNSSLLFAKTADITDCRLRAADLYGRQLRAELAVLSACNTGYGELQKGEGIMSFARAFSYAGVPSLVMSLWSITDASSASIFRSFYNHLKNGERKDEALRQAKLAYLKYEATPEHVLPVYWAGAVVVGDAAALSKNRNNEALYVAGLLVLAGLLFFFKSKALVPDTAFSGAQ